MYTSFQMTYIFNIHNFLKNLHNFVYSTYTNFQRIDIFNQESTNAAPGVPHWCPMRGAMGNNATHVSVLFFFFFLSFPDSR